MFEIDVNSTMCCGLGEISGIQDEHDISGDDYDVKEQFVSPSPFDIIKSYQHGRPYDFPFVIFTACDQKGLKKTRGTALTRFIRANKLGTVRQTGWKRNPNSGNNIQVFLWEPNYKSLQHLDPSKTKSR